MTRTILSPADAEWLTETLARNRARFAGWTMMATDDDGADDESEDDDAEDDTEDDSDDKLAPEDDPNSIEYWKKRSRQNEREAKRLRREANTKKPTPKSDDKGGDDKPDADQIRQAAKDEAAREVLNERIEDKIEAKARAFADPEDAVAVLLRTHSHDDFLDENNKIDVEAMTDALKELGEKKPHLLAQGGQRFQGGADGGPRKKSDQRPKNLGDAIARHYDKS
jgi:hypothetical protein